jgi:hypothetical protein
MAAGTGGTAAAESSDSPGEHTQPCGDSEMRAGVLGFVGVARDGEEGGEEGEEGGEGRGGSSERTKLGRNQSRSASGPPPSSSPTPSNATTSHHEWERYDLPMSKPAPSSAPILCTPPAERPCSFR